ncbi:phosphate/phosphite/phosphonate ABC transporter substrate-binding protein [soil metagenome]
MSRNLLTRRIVGLAGAAVLALGLTSCGGGDKPATGAMPTEITFAILPAEGQGSSGPLWQPLLDDMSKAVGVKVKPNFAANYNVSITAMQFNQAQIAWLSAKPELEAIERADAEVIARIVDPQGRDTYTSSLIVKKGSGITLDKVLACGKQYDFGLGDAQSTSGTLAPMTYLFNPRGIVPANCFKTVRSASHQNNTFAIGSGVLDVSTSNSVNTVFIQRENPTIAATLEEIWVSPPLPESGIVVRQDLNPALKEKIRAFLIGYGQGQGAEADRQRAVLLALNYSMFRAADDSYLDPVRLMVLEQKLNDAKVKNDTAAVTSLTAQAATLRTKLEVQP